MAVTDPVTPGELWETTCALASAWRTSDIVSDHCPQLLPGASNPPLARLLNNLKVVGANRIVSHPLYAASEVAYVLRAAPPGVLEGMSDISNQVSHLEGVELQAAREETRRQRDELIGWWMPGADALQMAAHGLLTWVRSRLPRYPIILAPQLARGTSYTTNEWTDRIAWLPQDYRSQLQLQAAPPLLASALRMDPAQVRDVEQLSRELLAAIAAQHQWHEFVAATESLRNSDIADLKMLRGSLRESLSKEEIDAFDDRAIHRRRDYRVEVLNTALTDASAPVRRLANAFEAVDDLICTVIGQVLGQLVAFGPPHRVVDSERLELSHDQPRRARVVCHGDFVDAGRLLMVDDPMLQDAMVVQGITVNMASPDQETRLTLEGQVLAESSCLRNYTW